MTEGILKIEEKWVWLDEDGIQCSPLHDSLGAAVRHKGNWKPYVDNPARVTYRKKYESTKRPRKLMKVEVTHRLIDDELSQSITEAFKISDEKEGIDNE